MIPGAASPNARSVTPEILDHLDAEDPRAKASRRDLARINGIMAQASIMSRLLRGHVRQPPASILDLGAGDGAFMLAVARRLARHWPGVQLILLDRRPSVSEENRAAFERVGWTVEIADRDVFAWLAESKGDRLDVVTANLFLHHFDELNLARLLRSLGRVCHTFVATEPRRNRLALCGARMLRVIGANEVTRHDALASVRAGFAGRELSAFWPRTADVRLEERRIGPFTHAFAASVQPGAGR